MGEEDNGAADIWGVGIRKQETQDASGDIPGADGWSDSVASAGSAYPAALSQGGTRPAAVSVVGDAAHLLCAVVSTT